MVLLVKKNKFEYEARIFWNYTSHLPTQKNPRGAVVQPPAVGMERLNME